MPPLRCVVDTNVAATANGSNPEAGERCRAACARALQAVMQGGHVFIDSRDLILSEYRRALKPGQPEPGNRFVKWLLQNQWVEASVTQVAVTPRVGAVTLFAELPEPASGVTYDPSDQVFLAVSAAHRERPPILQAFDSKWWGWRESLDASGVTVHFLCPAEIAAKHDEKMLG